jgi:hypothetical protein
MSNLSNQTGKPVRSSDFYDRTDFLAGLWQRISEGSNILLLAPRRVGKSSLIFRMESEALQKGFLPLVISVADAQSELQFIDRLLKKLNEQNHSESKKLFNRLAKREFVRKTKKFSLFSTITWEFGDNLDNRWKEVAEELLCGLRELPSKWLVMIDELPIFVMTLLQGNSTQRAATFLDWFRDLRIGPDAPRQIQWLVSGSIGLDTVTKQANLGDKINDLHLETRLGPFETSVAKQFLRDLGQNYSIQLSEDALDMAVEKIGWPIPFHLQLLFSEIRDTLGTEKSATITTIEQAYENLLSPAKRSRFDFWRQRLAKELPTPFNTHAIDLLDTCAVDPEGATRISLAQSLMAVIPDTQQRAESLDFLLGVLQTDGYVIHQGDRFRFQSPVLRDFWLPTRLS